MDVEWIWIFRQPNELATSSHGRQPATGSTWQTASDYKSLQQWYQWYQWHLLDENLVVSFFMFLWDVANAWNYMKFISNCRLLRSHLSRFCQQMETPCTGGLAGSRCDWLGCPPLVRANTYYTRAVHPTAAKDTSSIICKYLWYLRLPYNQRKFRGRNFRVTDF